MSQYKVGRGPSRVIIRDKGNGGNGIVRLAWTWRRSSRSNGNGGNNCVEIIVLDGDGGGRSLSRRPSFRR